jgi:enoyl-CoA hydratase
MSNTYRFLRIEVEHYVATVVMDRPPVNAQNSDFRTEMIDAFDRFNDRDDVRVIILTGTGRYFSAGADVKQRAQAVQEPGDYWRINRLAREYTNAIRECDKPVIAAVNGFALGAGFGLMASCDIMLASDDAVFGMPEVDVGIAGGAAMLQRLFGRSWSRYLLYTATRIPAAELYRLGVLVACVPRDRLMPEARQIAAVIAEKSPLAIQYAKQSMTVCEQMPQRDGYRFEQGLTVKLSKTEDTREAQKAFAEKRKPVFKGR